MSWSTSELRVRLAPLNRFKPSSKIFYWPFQGGTSFVDLLCFCSVLCLLCLCASVYMCFVVTCWERADLLALVCCVFCEFVTFPLVSWVRCGTWLYRFLIFAPLLTYKYWYLLSLKFHENVEQRGAAVTFEHYVGHHPVHVLILYLHTVSVVNS